MRAKRKGGQAIENKQFCEMAPFSPPMISTTYRQLAKPFVSVSEMNPLAFAGFSASPRPKTQWRESIASGARAADVARVCDSEMAPQAVRIAQTGLGNGPTGSQSPGWRIDQPNSV
jgi:hypothetical protein